MTDFTPARLAELRAVAEAATEGPWEADCCPAANMVYSNQGSIGVDATEDDAEHIAAFDPPTVIALIAALEAVLEFTTSESDTIRTQYDLTGGIPADYRGYANACDDVIALIEDALEAANESKPSNSVTSGSANERELAELRAALEAKTAEVEGLRDELAAWMRSCQKARLRLDQVLAELERWQAPWNREDGYRIDCSEPGADNDE